jgi:hypothetical protein
MMPLIISWDLSGSTCGWINDAERESLILLAESLVALGDRYAIYGFSGWTRKRCEAFRVTGVHAVCITISEEGRIICPTCTGQRITR